MRILGGVAAAVIVGGYAGAVPAGAAVHAITVTPSTGLSDGQVVQVSGAGFTETPWINDWAVAECRATILDQPITLDRALGNCDVTTQPFVFVHADSAGNLSTSFTVHSTFTLTTGGVGTVDCTVTPCAVLVSQIVNESPGFAGAAAPITFGGSPPPPPPPPCSAADRPGHGYGNRHHCHHFGHKGHDGHHGRRSGHDED